MLITIRENEMEFTDEEIEDIEQQIAAAREEDEIPERL